MDIGLKIKELANKENLDVSELAQKLGKTKQAVYDIFSKKDLNTSVLRELSKILNVPIVAFFQDEFEKNGKYQEKLDEAYKEIDTLRKEISGLRLHKKSSTKVVVEFDVNDDEFIKMGLKDKIIQVLGK